MTQSYLIKDGTLADGSQADLLISEGLIAEIGKNVQSKNAQVVSAKDSIVLPGLVDLHTHLREPGKED